MDVSAWKTKIDWTSVKNTNIKFAIARASVLLILLQNNFVQYGLSIDNYFAANWKGMIDNGIKPGAYHYYIPSDDAAA